MDHAVDEVYEQLEEVVVDDEVADAEGFSSGLHDTSVLIAYVDHVAVIVWNGKVFIFLNKLYFNKYLLLLLK